MESPFIYNKYVTGKNFIGRKNDINILGNLMAAGENISIYEPPRSGKTSAIQQAFFNMRIQGRRSEPPASAPSPPRPESSPTSQGACCRARIWSSTSRTTPRPTKSCR